MSVPSTSSDFVGSKAIEPPLGSVTERAAGIASPAAPGTTYGSAVWKAPSAPIDPSSWKVAPASATSPLHDEGAKKASWTM